MAADGLDLETLLNLNLKVKKIVKPKLNDFHTRFFREIDDLFYSFRYSQDHRSQKRSREIAIWRIRIVGQS